MKYKQYAIKKTTLPHKLITNTLASVIEKETEKLDEKTLHHHPSRKMIY